jgi:hypothetical protein
MSDSAKMLVLTASLMMWSYVTAQRAFIVNPILSFNVMQMKKNTYPA